ncbi:nucleotidyltransferase substrate binding protein [Rickettsiales bacterium]|nr:nucleotidyltransferase substrate binding protein [Rickettsiales bacterium]
MSEKLRWEYRFDNYKRAFLLLREAMELRSEKKITPLEEEGIIQRFEYSWELAWKTLKDYLDNEGVVLEKITPKEVIIKAIEAKIIIDREKWMKTLDDRNKMSHQYSHEVFSQVIENIENNHFGLFDYLYEKLLHETNK